MEVIGIGTCAFRSTVDVSTRGIGPVNPWSRVGTSYSDIQAMGASQSRRIRSPVISLIGLVLPTSPKPILACKAGHRTRGQQNTRALHQKQDRQSLPGIEDTLLHYMGSGTGPGAQTASPLVSASVGTWIAPAGQVTAYPLSDFEDPETLESNRINF